ncbi:MAG: DMT family transporter [Hyphomicrobiaceae bacterium]
MASTDTPTAQPPVAHPVAAAEPVRAPRHDVVAGICWVTIAMVLFAALAAASKMAIQLGYDPLQVVFMRNAAAMLLLLPMLGTRGFDLVRSHSIHLYGIRVLISLTSMTAWFYALSVIPMGEITAIGFLSPIFGTLAAIIFLGEKVRLRRWTAIIVGFIGAMIMLRPGHAPLGVGQLCALVSALSGGIIAVLLKRLSNSDDPEKIVFITTAMLTPMSLLPALFVWKTPGVELAPVLAVIAVTGVLGHIALMRGFAAIDASLLLTFEFSRLPFVVGIGYVMFGELIDMWTWIGAAIVMGSAAYIAHREAKVRRERLQ